MSVKEATAGIDVNGILTKNPFRYRGYYYDEETGFYYLNVRYYDPQVRRFISADDMEYLGAAGSVTGYNLFLYCGNSPVNYSDNSGHLQEWIHNGIAYEYNGTAADFHRLESGQSPLAYESAIQYEKAVFAAIIYGEAGAQNEQSKRAVANVIMNRVGTKETYNSIIDVVSDNNQFLSYQGKMYNEAINYYTNGIIENEYSRRVLKKTMKIADSIYMGEEEDITGGCTNFYSPCSRKIKGSVPDWANNMTEVTIDGVDPWEFRFFK